MKIHILEFDANFGHKCVMKCDYSSPDFTGRTSMFRMYKNTTISIFIDLLFIISPSSNIDYLTNFEEV